MRREGFLFLACLWLIFDGAFSALRISGLPVHLNLRRLPRGTNASQSGDPAVMGASTEGRTKPKLFQKILGLVPGKEGFEFPLPKWRALQRSGLFHNLTARTAVVDEQMVLEVSGIELPSITFAPEVSMVPSLRNVELSGGMVFRDNNFRGMGELLEVVLSRKEGADAELGRLPAALRMRWTDCAIGSAAGCRVTAAWQSEGLRDSAFNLMQPVPEGADPAALRVSALSQRLTASFQTAISLGKVQLEPYLRLLTPHPVGGAGKEVRQSGAKLTCELALPSGLQGCVWQDAGFLGGRPYRQLGAELIAPTLRKPLLLLQVAADREPRYLELLGKLRLSGMHAWGDGCLPAEQHYSLGSSSILRGHPATASNAAHTVRSLLALKADAYLNLMHCCKIGVFADAAAFAEGDGRPQTASTVGCSLRSQGIRVDAGMPCRGPSRRPRLYFGLDFGE